MTKIHNIFKSKPTFDDFRIKSKPTFDDFRIKSKATGKENDFHSTHQTTHSIQLSGVMTAVSLTSYAVRNDNGN